MECCASRPRSVGGRNSQRQQAAQPPAALTAMKMSELRKKAIGAGIEPALLESADDSADPRGELVALLLQHTPAARQVESTESVRAELEKLKMSEIRRRAAMATEITEQEMDEADDASDSRAALIDLLAHSTGGQRPLLMSIFSNPETEGSTAARVGGALERGAEALDGLLISIPRKARRQLQVRDIVSCTDTGRTVCIAAPF